MRISICISRWDRSLNAASFTAEEMAWVASPKDAIFGSVDIFTI